MTTVPPANAVVLMAIAPPANVVVLHFRQISTFGACFMHTLNYFVTKKETKNKENPRSKLSTARGYHADRKRTKPV